MSAPKCPICSKTMVKMVKLPQESSGGNVGDGARDPKSAVDQIWSILLFNAAPFMPLIRYERKLPYFLVYLQERSF